MDHRSTTKLYTPTFFLLFLAHLALVSSFAAFFLFPLYITQNGGTEFDIGILMGVFAMASAFSRPAVSALIDKIGRKHCYSLGALIMVLIPLLHLAVNGSVNDSYWLLTCLRLVHGLGQAICFTVIYVLIGDRIPVRRLNEGLGMFSIAGIVGVALGPLITEPVIQSFGFKGFFLATSAMAAGALVLQLLVPQYTPEDRQHDRSNAPSFFSLLKTRKFIVCGGIALLFGIGLAATSDFIAPFAEAKGYAFISSYYLAYSCAAIIVRLASGRLADRIGENAIIPWAIVLLTVSLFMVPLTNGKLMLVIVGFIFGAGHGFLFPALNAMAVRNEPYEKRGKAVGIFTGGIDSGNFIGAIILGIIGETAGFSVLFIAGGIFTLTALELFRHRPHRKRIVSG